MSECICPKAEHFPDPSKCGGPNILGNQNPLEAVMYFLPAPFITGNFSSILNTIHVHFLCFDMTVIMLGNCHHSLKCRADPMQDLLLFTSFIDWTFRGVAGSASEVSVAPAEEVNILFLICILGVTDVQ